MTKTMANTEGVNPVKTEWKCANCGGRANPTRQVGAYANVPCECEDCESTGTVTKNRLGMVTGSYGAVEVNVKD